MDQYISKDALKAEIKKLSQKAKELYGYSQFNTAYDNVLSILDTLEVKEVDLEKEMDKEWSKCEPIDEGMGLEIASIEHEQFDNIAKHFYELGFRST